MPLFLLYISAISILHLDSYEGGEVRMRGVRFV